MEIPQAMAFADIDPSLALGFLCSTQTEFENFCANATAVFLHCSLLSMVLVHFLTPFTSER